MTNIKNKLNILTLSNDLLDVTLINFGATIQSIKMKLLDKTIRNITLNNHIDEVEKILSNKLYFGATCGRTICRTKSGKFSLKNKI
jgi:galactose mutarotase-like enzyme